jgi:hypothetical protein
MNPKVTIVLILVFIGLGTLALFDPFHWKDKKVQAVQKDNSVFWWPDAKSSWVELEADGKKIRIECAEKDAGCGWDSQSNWRISEPVAEAADSSNVGGFLNALKNLNPIERVDFENESVNLAAYGLDKPAQKIRIQLVGHANAYTILIGNPAAIGESRYLYTDASPHQIFLVANYLPDLAKKDLLHWRDKRLFPAVDASGVARLAWEDFTKKRSFAFEKASDGFWRMSAPLKVPANGIMIEGLVSTVAYTSAQKVVDPKQVKLGKQVLTINITDKTAKTHSITLFANNKPAPQPRVGEEQDVEMKYYAKSSDREWLTEIDALPFARFQKELSEYRTIHLLSAFEKNLAQEMELNFARDNKRVVLQLQENTWKYKSGDALKSLAHARLKTFFESLATVESQSFETNTKNYQSWKKSLGDLVLTLRGGDGRIFRVIKFVVITRDHAA